MGDVVYGSDFSQQLLPLLLLVSVVLPCPPPSSCLLIPCSVLLNEPTEPSPEPRFMPLPFTAIVLSNLIITTLSLPAHGLNSSRGFRFIDLLLQHGYLLFVIEALHNDGVVPNRLVPALELVHV